VRALHAATSASQSPTFIPRRRKCASGLFRDALALPIFVGGTVIRKLARAGRIARRIRCVPMTHGRRISSRLLSGIAFTLIGGGVALALGGVGPGLFAVVVAGTVTAVAARSQPTWGRQSPDETTRSGTAACAVCTHAGQPRAQAARRSLPTRVATLSRRCCWSLGVLSDTLGGDDQGGQRHAGW
jgi:hypothetical protein